MLTLWSAGPTDIGVGMPRPASSRSTVPRDERWKGEKGLSAFAGDRSEKRMRDGQRPLSDVKAASSANPKAQQISA
jgi:hypothetical protein